MAQRCAVVQNGTVINVIIADAGFDPKDGSIIVPSDTAEAGDIYDGKVFKTPTPAIINQTQGLNFLQFMALFTPTEQAAVVGSNDVQVRIFNLMAAGAPAIDLDNAQVTQGVQYLAATKLITSARATIILSGAAPT